MYSISRQQHPHAVATDCERSDQLRRADIPHFWRHFFAFLEAESGENVRPRIPPPSTMTWLEPAGGRLTGALGAVRKTAKVLFTLRFSVE